MGCQLNLKYMCTCRYACTNEPLGTARSAQRACDVSDKKNRLFASWGKLGTGVSMYVCKQSLSGRG